MKTILTILLLALLSTQAVADTNVTIEVRGVTRDEGTMVLTVYEGKKSWLKKGMLQTSVPVDGQGTVVMTVELPASEYAFHVYQDLDTDGKMKTNFIGIPKEPTGVSNNAKGRFGPPKYKDAKVTVGDDAVTVPMNLTEID